MEQTINFMRKRRKLVRTLETTKVCTISLSDLRAYAANWIIDSKSQKLLCSFY